MAVALAKIRTFGRGAGKVTIIVGLMNGPIMALPKTKLAKLMQEDTIKPNV